MTDVQTALESVRSYLYVPADQRKLLEKALDRGADALIVDLEDSVAASQKSVARSEAFKWLEQQDGVPIPVLLRINSTSPEDDIEVLQVTVSGVMVPGAQVELVSEVSDLLGEHERQLGLASGTFKIIPLIETAQGLLQAVELAAMGRVSNLALGKADLSAELGLSISQEGFEWDSLLLQLVVASSAARISAPIAPTSTDFRDLEQLRLSTERLRRLGFRSRTAIHPAQLPIINDVLTPSLDEVQRAQKLVQDFEDSERSGAGVLTDAEGRMVDVAVVRRARSILSLAKGRLGSL
ncbi:MAG: CoA ester lyase [Cryobacterium sp.]|nr:CoA ester lyase [Cryobacterium sp.]